VKRERPRGILNVRPAHVMNGLARYWPSADLAVFVEHYWIVRWDLSEPRVAETIPHPSVHMVLGDGSSEVVGVMRTRFSRRIEGRGRVVGTKFRPGAFRPFVAQPISAFTGRRFTAPEVFGARAEGLAERVFACDDDRDGIAIIESFLRAFHPVADEQMTLAGRVAARIADDRRIARVDQLVGEFQTSVRQLQRLFKEYVGISPKWVIQRYRLLEGAERVPTREPLNWAELALDLGYADQAHFIRDFKRFIGRSPAEYARHLEQGQ
jgi:AraC-like DNA-binding protein